MTKVRDHILNSDQKSGAEKISIFISTTAKDVLKYGLNRFLRKFY